MLIRRITAAANKRNQPLPAMCVSRQDKVKGELPVNIRALGTMREQDPDMCGVGLLIRPPQLTQPLFVFHIRGIVNPADVDRRPLHGQGSTFPFQHRHPGVSQPLLHPVNALAPVLVIAGNVEARTVFHDLRDEGLRIVIRQPVIEDIPGEQHGVRFRRRYFPVIEPSVHHRKHTNEDRI